MNVAHTANTLTYCLLQIHSSNPWTPKFIFHIFVLSQPREQCSAAAIIVQIDGFSTFSWNALLILRFNYQSNTLMVLLVEHIAKIRIHLNWLNLSVLIIYKSWLYFGFWLCCTIESTCSNVTVPRINNAAYFFRMTPHYVVYIAFVSKKEPDKQN